MSNIVTITIIIIIIIIITKFINLIWNKLKMIKIIGLRKQIRNQKKNDQNKINNIIIEKNHKLDFNDKIKNYKIFDKRVKKIKIKSRSTKYYTHT